MKQIIVRAHNGADYRQLNIADPVLGQQVFDALFLVSADHADVEMRDIMHVGDRTFDHDEVQLMRAVYRAAGDERTTSARVAVCHYIRARCNADLRTCLEAVKACFEVDGKAIETPSPWG